jgi:hypothetical protein
LGSEDTEEKEVPLGGFESNQQRQERINREYGTKKKKKGTAQLSLESQLK